MKNAWSKIFGYDSYHLHLAVIKSEHLKNTRVKSETSKKWR